MLLKIVTETPPRPIHLDPTIPRWLDEVIVKALSRTPSDRFESAEQMREALQRPIDAAHGAALHRRRSAPPSPLAINTDAPTMLSMSGPFGRTSGEHRIVSLLSVQAGDDAALVEATRSAIDHSGGLAQRLLGGVVVGLFGVEHTVGDEALRCVTAGLAARNAARGPARLLAATVRVEVSEGLSCTPRSSTARWPRSRRCPPTSWCSTPPRASSRGRWS
ncbi:MAG: hypothetical protein M5U28_33355 [Sandaracinaceae bacterium]|nr:hypothetical protein [Sandaracinaceae bacterium]